MFPSPLRIFNQPETRTAFPSLPPFQFANLIRSIFHPRINTCSRVVQEKGGGHENRQPFRFTLPLPLFVKVTRARYFEDALHRWYNPSLLLFPCGARNRTREEMMGARAAFSCGGGKSSRSQRRDRIAVDVPPSLHPPPPSKLPSATPSPAAILIGEPPTSRISPLPPPTYQRRSAALPRLFAVPFASTPFGDHPDFDGIRGSDLDKFFLLKFFPSPRKVLKLIEFSSSFLRWGIRVQYHWFLLVFFLKCFEKFNTSKWFFSNISFVEY